MSVKLKREILSKAVQTAIFNIFSKLFQKSFLNVFTDINLVSLEDIFSFYNKNKKMLLNKGDAFFQFLERHISSMELDFSFMENIDIDNLIKKFERLCANNGFSFMSNDIRKKVAENFRNILNVIAVMYICFLSETLDYASIFSNIRIVRAPPLSSFF